jgi:hypothetical protein
MNNALMKRLTFRIGGWHVGVRLTLGFLLALGLAWAFTQSTQAATYTIPCTDGVGNVDALRSAITTVNSNGQADTIELEANCVYKLSYADHPGLIILPDGGRPLTINGNGATIDGDPNYPKDIFDIRKNAVVEINRLTIMGSRWGGDRRGGAIINAGTLTLNGSTLTKNDPWAGGVLTQLTDGSMTVNNSTVSGNYGTGIEVNPDSTLTLNNSTAANNDGAALSLNGTPQVFLNNSIVEQCVINARISVTAYHTLMGKNQRCVTHEVDGNIVLADSDRIPLRPLTGNPPYHPLPPASPAINAGDNSLVPTWMTTDQAGNPRIAGVNLPVDMGAVEYQILPRTVDVGASLSNVQEGAPVRITFYRTAPFDDLMSVYFSVITTGADQVEVRDLEGNLLQGRVTMPAGASSVDVWLTSLVDGIAEANELIQVRVLDSDSYEYHPGTLLTADINVSANDFGVTNLNDFNGDGASAAAREGTLRQALENARNLLSDDTITFLNVEGEIILTGGPLVVNDGGA